MWGNRSIQIIKAPSILGLRPTGVEKLADTLLSNGLKESVRSESQPIEIPTFNDAYTNIRHSKSSLLNEPKLAAFSLSVYQTVLSVSGTNTFLLMLGGDCSILIGVMAALKSIGNYGLLFMDAHEDFYLPHQSVTGEAADMDLAIVTGRGPDTLTDINNLKPYSKDEHVWHIGQRDQEEVKKYGSQTIHNTSINCFSYSLFEEEGLKHISDKIVGQASSAGLDGFWVHFDSDVLSDKENPAVDYRLPGGLSFSQCEYLLKRLLASLPVIGMTITIFNPKLDQKGVIGQQLTQMLIRVLDRNKRIGFT